MSKPLTDDRPSTDGPVLYQHRRPLRRGASREATGRTAGDGPPSGFGRAATIGAVIGYLVVLILVIGIVLVTGAGVASALAIGAFAALWGGPGWGGMIGAVRYADRFGDEERGRRTTVGCAPATARRDVLKCSRPRRRPA